MKRRIFAALALIAAIVAGFGLHAYAMSNDVRITVIGNGTLQATPDQLRFAFTLDGDLDNLAKAQQSITASLISHGVKKSAIEATFASGEQNPCLPQTCAQPMNTSLNNVRSLMIRVTSEDLSQSGSMIADAFRLAEKHDIGIRVASTNLEFGDRGALEAQAKAKAVANAHSQAKQIAKSANKRLGRLVSIDVQDYGPPYAGDVQLQGEANASRTTPIAIQPGSQEITASVTMTYVLR